MAELPTPALRVRVPTFVSLLVVVVFCRVRIFTLPSWLVSAVVPFVAARLLLKMFKSLLLVIVILFAAVMLLCFWVTVFVVVVVSSTIEFEFSEARPRLYSAEVSL